MVSADTRMDRSLPKQWSPVFLPRTWPTRRRPPREEPSSAMSVLGKRARDVDPLTAILASDATAYTKLIEASKLWDAAQRRRSDFFEDLRPFVAELADAESPRSLLALFAEYETKTDEQARHEVHQLVSEGLIESSRARQLSELNAANRRRALLTRVLEIHAELDDDDEGDHADADDPYGKEEGDDGSEGDDALTAEYIAGLTAADCVECPEAAEDEAVRDVPRWIMGRPTAELVEMAAALSGEAGEAGEAPPGSSSRLELVQTLLRATMAAAEEEEGEDEGEDEDEIGDDDEEGGGGEEHKAAAAAAGEGAAGAGGAADEGEAPSTPPGKRLPAPDGCAQQ